MPLLSGMKRNTQTPSNTLVNALNTALLGGFISLDAAVDLLAQYIDTMKEYATDDPEIPGERERIIKSWYLRIGWKIRKDYLTNCRI